MELKNKKKKKRLHGDNTPPVSPTRQDPKKVKVQHNPQIIPGSTQKVQSTTTEAEEIEAVKPIVTRSSLVIVRDTCCKLKLSRKPIFKVINNNSTQISCSLLSDKKIVLEALRGKLINHFTYTEPSEKPVSLVLKGFYDEDPVEILSILKNNNVPANKVTVLFKNDFHTLYVVSFIQSTINCNLLNHNHRIIDDITVKWEQMKSKTKVRLQCHRCQRWGHSATNCGFQYRCVKCTEDHPIGECSRKTREGNAKCCNCRGDHSANHRGCEAFKAFEKRITNHQPAKKQQVKMIQQRLKADDFPTLVNSSSASLSQPLPPKDVNTPTYSQQLQSQPQVSASGSKESQSVAIRLSELSNQLLDIPNIQNTFKLLQTLIDELKLISDDRKRVLLIIQFCSDYQLPNDGL